MTEGIQPNTVFVVGRIMADALGKDWCRDRKEVVDYINRFREDLYLMYPELRLFTDKFYCLQVSCFPEQCGNTCSCKGNTYRGVTIPQDIDGVLAVWEDHIPMRTYSKWWEARVGVITTGQPRTKLAATLVAETFPTERALTRPSKLHFYASSAEDNGKLVDVRADTCKRKDKEYHVTLAGDGVSKIPDEIKTIHSIVLPAGLCGSVTVTQADGYELSEFGGYDSVPMFRRLKISSPCPTCKVLLQGSLAFRPIYHDTDIVEVGSRRILETAARIYRYGESGTDPAEQRKATSEEAKLRKLLQGAIDRKRGNSSQDAGIMTRKSLIRTRTLPGYEARRG